MIKKLLNIIRIIKYDFKSFLIYLLNKRVLNKFKLKLKKIILINDKTNIIFEEFIKISKNYSMCSHGSQKNIIDSINFVARNNIEGDFVECGVWKGGNLILFQLVCDHLNIKKKIYGYDLFDHMPEGGKFDIDKFGNKASYYKNHPYLNSEWCNNPIEETKNNINNHFDNHNVNLIKGDACLTLKSEENIPDKISLLRLDTDFYNSTKCLLEILYPKLSKGGVLIIDDYNWWQGCRKAVDEYFEGQNIFFHHIKTGGAYLIKE